MEKLRLSIMGMLLFLLAGNSNGLLITPYKCCKIRTQNIFKEIIYNNISESWLIWDMMGLIMM